MGAGRQGVIDLYKTVSVPVYACAFRKWVPPTHVPIYAVLWVADFRCGAGEIRSQSIVDGGGDLDTGGAV